MKHLIVNADDFGYAGGINDGIMKAHREGIVTSATLMATAVAFDHAVRLARSAPALDVGCHLVLISGRALSNHSEAPGLVDEAGNLPRTIRQFAFRLLQGDISPRDLKREIAAQLDKIRNAGLTVSHIDSHKHTHVFPSVARDYRIPFIRNPIESTNGLRNALRALAGRRVTFTGQFLLGLLTRAVARNFGSLCQSFGMRRPDDFYSIALSGLLKTRILSILIESLRDGVSELMCRPGVLDETLVASPARL